MASTFAAFSESNGSIIGIYRGLRLFLFFFVESDIMNPNKQTKYFIKTHKNSILVENFAKILEFYL